MGERTNYLKVAESYVGAKRGDGRYEQMLAWFSKNPKGLKADTENCSEFTVACALQALGINQHIIPISNTANAQAKMWKSLSKTPSVGSLVYFDFKDGNGISHVEIVTDVGTSTITTINGNHDHKVVKMSRLRSYKYIAGYGVPAWPKEGIDMTEWQKAAAGQILLKKGSYGTMVLWLQKYLKTEGFYKNGIEDSKFGAYMQTEVKKWQKANGLYVDGIIGVNCWNYIFTH